MNLLVNVLLFQIGWFACVVGAAYGLSMAGAGVALSIVVLHILRATRARTELVLVLLVGVIGTAWDSILMTLGWLNYSGAYLLPNLVPLWMIALWMLFATTFNVSLRWLKNRPMLAALFGVLGGPLAYYAGHALGAVGMPDVGLALTAQAIGWGILTPVLMQMSNRFDGMTTAEREARPCLT